MAAAEATEPPSLADWEMALSEVSSWPTRSARSASLGEVSLTPVSKASTWALSCAKASPSPEAGGAVSSLAMRASSAAISGCGPLDPPPPRPPQARARPTTPTRPPSTPAARWVTKLFSSGRLACAGGSAASTPCGASPAISGRSAPAAASASRARIAAGGLFADFGRGAFDGLRRALARAAWAMILIAERVCHHALPFTPSSYRAFHEDAASESTSARTSCSRGRAATRTVQPSGITASATASDRQ